MQDNATSNETFIKKLASHWIYQLARGQCARNHVALSCHVLVSADKMLSNSEHIDLSMPIYGHGRGGK